MLAIQSVCNDLIFKSMQENISLSPLKLQKITYFIYGYGLAKYKKKLFNADFYAWRLGPVCEPIYQEFKCYGSNKITSYAQDACDKAYFPNWANPSNKELYDCLYEVWNKYKHYDGASLVSLTHKKGSAWEKTNSNQRINEEDIVKDVEGGLY